MAELFEQIMEAAEKDFRPVVKHNEKQLKEAADLVFQGKINGRYLSRYERAYRLQEALSTSDFGMLFGDVLDRAVLAKYQTIPQVYKAFAKTNASVVDFRLNRRFKIWGGTGLMPAVTQGAEYQDTKRSEIQYPLQAYKYGSKFDIDWESIINDDLGALQDTPARMADSASYTEQYLATQQYAGDIGAHIVETTKPTPTNGHLFSPTGAAFTRDGANCYVDLLTIANVAAAIARMQVWTDLDGTLVRNRPVKLVVPPILELPARSILTSSWILSVQGGSNTDTVPTMLPTANTLAQYGLSLGVDPLLPIIDTVNGNTGWYLFADPAVLPSLEIEHMQGHEVPEIAMKASNKVSVGGAPMSPMSGDFDTDSIKYRVRLILARTSLDWRGCYMGGAVTGGHV